MFKTKTERILLVLLAIIGILFAFQLSSALAQTPEQRCFTFNGNVRDRAPQPDIVASMGDAWIPQTPFYQAGVVEGQAVSYNICVDQDTGMANITASSLWPVGGSGDPVNGYPRPAQAFNTYDSDIVLVGDANEYIQVHGFTAPSTEWDINDPVTIIHSAHILHNPPFTYNGITHYDWVSRIYIDGWIFEIDPPGPYGPMPYVLNDVLYIDNFFDVRVEDESHPGFGFQTSRGGWSVGLSVFDPDFQAEISRVEIIGSNPGSYEATTVINTPDAFGWLGQTLWSYGVVIGSRWQVSPQYEIIVYDLAGDRITFDDGNGPYDSIFLYPGKDNLLPPICKIKNMSIKKKTGEVKMKFIAPSDPNLNHIRIRLFNEDGDAVHQIRVDPPFEIIRNDGVIILGMVKLFLDPEWAGHSGRIEYRTNGSYGNGDSGYMLRGITNFQLPVPEPVVE